MEPNSSSHAQTVDLTRPPPEYPGPSTSGFNTPSSPQESSADGPSNETSNTSESQSSNNTQGQLMKNFILFIIKLLSPKMILILKLGETFFS